MKKLARRRFVAATLFVLPAVAVYRKADGQTSMPSTLSGNGTSDDGTMLRAALDAARLKGGGVIDLPEGIFLVAPPEGANAALMPPSGTTLRGVSREKTIIRMAEGVNGHVINANEGGVTIRDLTVDGGNRAKAGFIGHNIRMEGDNNVIERVRSANSASYGIGLGQRRYVRNCHLRDVEIVNAGADGVDLKNKLGRTEVTFEKIIVRGFGQGPRKTNQAGIDLRGKCVLRDIIIDGVAAGTDGLRFRFGEEAIDNGPGAHGAIGSDIVVRSANPKSGVGIAVTARDVSLTDVRVSGVGFAVRIAQSGFNLRNGALTATNFILGRMNRDWPVDGAIFENVEFRGDLAEASVEFPNSRFVNCRFHDCKRTKPGNIRSTFIDCKFDKACLT